MNKGIKYASAMPKNYPQWATERTVADFLFNAYSLKGDIAFSLGHYVDAVAAYKAASSMERTNAVLLASWANSLSNLGQFADAISLYERSLALETKRADSSTWKYLGYAHQKLGNHTNAFIGFKRCFDLNPLDADANLVLAGYYFPTNAAAAIPHYARASEQHKTNWTLFVDWGNALQRVGAFEQAEEKHRIATTLNSSSADAYKGLGLALLNRKKHEEAAAAFSNVIMLASTDSLANYWLGAYAAMKAETNAALKFFDTAAQGGAPAGGEAAAAASALRNGTLTFTNF